MVRRRKRKQSKFYQDLLSEVKKLKAAHPACWWYRRITAYLLLLIATHELLPVVTDHPGMGSREALQCFLKCRFHTDGIAIPAKGPGQDVAAKTIDDATEISRPAIDNNMGDVCMPVTMYSIRLLETEPFATTSGRPAAKHTSFLQDEKHSRRVQGSDVCIEHHVGAASIPIENMVKVKRHNDSLLFRRHLACTTHMWGMLIRSACAAPPDAKLTGRDA